MVTKMPKTFNYFAYGSNLARYRLGISCPSSTKLCNASLTGFKLVFGLKGKRWNGGPASIDRTGDDADRVWGIVWQIKEEELPNLDQQESVSAGFYQVLNVEVESENGDKISCRTYQIKDLGKEGRNYCLPSPQYLDVIIDGAVTNSLPSEYVQLLKNVETNDNQVITEVMKSVAELKKKNKKDIK